MKTGKCAMSQAVSDLINKHPDLAASIFSGAMEAVAERLTPTDPNTCHDVWYDGGSHEWQGSQVDELCIGIAEEIKRRCADIVPNNVFGKEKP